MDERRYFDVISGRQSGAVAGFLRAGLSIAAPFYGSAIGTRNTLFDSGWKRVHHVGEPVVSVGNITTGGTGKTPLVAWLADWFTSQGMRPAIISRGYRSLDEQGNDERRVLQQLCPNVPHEQDRDRAAAARHAIAAHRPDVLILDDGFQHRRLARNLDLVLIDALNPWGYGRLLPRGLLREPKSSLQRADAVIITRADQCSPAELSTLRSEIASLTSVPIAEVTFPPKQLVSMEGNVAVFTELRGKKLFSFCGIGNPDAFGRTLSACGLATTNAPPESFPDHHHYTDNDLRRLESLARAHQADALVTTQKDLVKIDPTWLDLQPLWGIVIGAEFRTGETQVTELLTDVFDETNRSVSG